MWVSIIWKKLTTKEAMNELALFAGAGGGILGGHLLGWRTVCAVEWEAYPASVLCARQNDGLLPSFPIWDDVQTFDGKPWRGIVDVVSGGFPCQDISVQGKGGGIDGKRSGMWSQMARIIGEVRPKYAFIENSPMLTSRGLERVLADLASMGFDAEWGVLGADYIGLPHHRERIWVLASDSSNKYVERSSKQKILGKPRLQSVVYNGMDKNQQGLRSILSSGLCRTFNGFSGQVDRIKAIGNAQVPRVAAIAFNILKERFENGKH
jgi:DNA (cytosine-5)-methyltransferase 1